MRRRFRVLIKTIRITLHLWGLDRVEAGLCLLKAVTDVNASVVAALGNSEGARPSERLDNIDRVALVALTTQLLVLLLVTADFAQPGGLWRL